MSFWKRNNAYEVYGIVVEYLDSGRYGREWVVSEIVGPGETYRLYTHYEETGKR